MSSTSLSILRGVCLVALISLLHCAYSAAQHRFYLRLTEQPFTHLPLDITLQTILSLVAFIYSTTYIAGEFQPIRSDLQDRAKSWDTVGNCPSFYTFHHRAKTLSPLYRALRQQSSVPISKETASFLTAFCKEDFGDNLCKRFPIGTKHSSQEKFHSKRPSKEVLNKALQYCLQLTRKRDYGNYVAGLIMPSEIQPALFTVLAFNVELAVIRDQVVRNSGISEIYRLQFWKDTLDTLYNRTNGPLPRQPVATALSFSKHCFEEHLLRNLVTARQKTLGDRPFSSLNDVRKYGLETTGSLILLTMKLLSRSHPCDEVSLPAEAVKAASSMSSAISIITSIRSVMPLLSRGVFLLPTDLTNKYELSAEDIFGIKKQCALRNLIRELVDVAEEELLKSRRYHKNIHPNLRMALMSSGATLDHLIATLRKNNYSLLDKRLQRGYEFLAWRLWWRSLLCRY
ncbi:unnamed protein product [Thelazia callipaeda]|uniref:UPF0551 protein C8orf38 homolog, mitochondrial n=1 Tax=Thelazia callipaeda TaxID=103827 RepID=A0A158RC68_THECL|nr:unnamed protein product [Thelazia callipaeda]